jgi:hypothetical protein
MNRRRLLASMLLVAVALVALLVTPIALRAPTADFQPVAQNQSEPAVSGLPLQFELNVGQADAAVKLLARGFGYLAMFASDQVALVLPTAAGSDRSSMLRMRFVGGTSEPQVTGVDPLPGVVNYYIGRDPAQWHSGIPTYARVRYQGLYPGIDLIFYGNRRQLEHDFLVSPGSDPAAIRVRAEGARSLEIDGEGDLILATADGQLRFHKPLIYQEVDGIKRVVDGGYLLKGEHEYGFWLATYDAGEMLVIDPVLDYSSYFGGSEDDYGYGVALDVAGNVYITGATNSSDFPLANPAQPGWSPSGLNCPSDATPYRRCYDVFVTKLNPAGTAMIYSTYFGDPGDDEGRAIAVDRHGNAYVTGYMSANSESLPEYYIYKRILALKLSPAGAFVYGGYFGSGTSEGKAIAVDDQGRAYLTGETKGGLPTTANALQPEEGELIDGFVSVLDPNAASFVYSSYLGGSGPYCEVCYSSGRGIAVDSAGMIYVTGQAAPSFPTTANAFQREFGGFWVAYVAKIDPTRAGVAGLLYSTYLGGDTNDFGSGIALDGAGNVYITGSSNSKDFPTTAGAFDRTCGTDGRCNATDHQVCYPIPTPPYERCTMDSKADAFVAKLNLSQSGAASLLYATFIGGSGRDEGRGIGMDSSGNAYVTGITASPDFPVARAIQSSHGGKLDGFALKLNAAGSALVYSTFLGGGADDEGSGIAVEPGGTAFVTGDTGSAAFPVANPLRPRSGGWEAFITRISDSGTDPIHPHRLFLPSVVR